jgi:hypothetical protein
MIQLSSAINIRGRSRKLLVLKYALYVSYNSWPIIRIIMAINKCYGTDNIVSIRLSNGVFSQLRVSSTKDDLLNAFISLATPLVAKYSADKKPNDNKPVLMLDDILNEYFESQIGVSG